MYNIKDFGAIGNRDNATFAIQSAADKCRENGGGTIFVPAGEYVVSSVRLYSNTTLEIDNGACLLTDVDERNYGHQRGIYETPIKRDVKTVLNIDVKDREELDYMRKLFLEVLRLKTDTMFFAENEENITIRGGELNGRFPLFYDMEIASPKNKMPRWNAPGSGFSPKKFRPHMLVFRKCKNVVLENTDIKDAPFFNIRIIECDTARCENLNITTDKRCINTDGINIAASKNCTVCGCRFVTGDDCIALSVGENLSQSCDCENIKVINCTGNTTADFVRIFSGIDVDLGCVFGISGEHELDIARKQKVTNVEISDCTVEDGGCSINIVSTYGSVENIDIRNIKAFQSGGEPAAFIVIQKEGKVENVKIDGLDCRARGIATILGTDRDSMKNVTFSNCSFLAEPTTKLFGNGIIDPLTEYWVAYQAPYNFYIRHASNIVIENCKAEWGKADLYDIMEVGNPDMRPPQYEALWREDMNPRESFPCVSCYDVDGLTIDNFKCTGFNGCDWLETEKTENVILK